MADGVAVTPGAGATVATDELSNGQHAQVVKIAYSADGSPTLTTVDADGVLVNLGANNDVSVSGSVTANAGTNLNTSALALETGGNLAAAVTSLQLLDNAIAGNEMQIDIVTMPSVTIAGTVDTELSPAAVLADNTANPTVTSVGTFGHIWDGATWDRTPGTSADGALVNLGGNNDVIVTSATITAALPAGTNAIGKLAANTGVDIGDVDVTSIVPGAGATNLGKAEDAAHTTGDVGVMALAVSNEANTARAADGDYLPLATDTEGNTRNVGNRDHDAIDAGEPVKIGARAIAHGTNPTAVAAADRTDLFANRAGVLFVIGGHPNVVTLRANYAAAQTDTAIVTVAGGLKIVVTRISVTADKANTVDVQARIGFGAANTPTTTGVVLSHPGIAAGSGVVEGNGMGILGVGADGEDLRITSEIPTSGSIDVVVSYFTIES